MGGLAVTRPQALAWRLARHLLDPVGDASVVEVVRRLGAVPTMDGAKAELAVRTRRRDSAPGELAAAVDAGDLVQVFAFRGAVHVLAPDDAGAYLALRGAGRQWELRSWQEHYRLGPADWPPLLDAVHDALADGPLTLPELGAAVTRHRRFRHLRPTFEDGAGTLMKPLTWQGAMGFGPRRAGRPTFQRLDRATGWAGIWDVEEAGRYCVTAYLGAYGPATAQHVRSWLGGGLSAGSRRIERWLDEVSDRLVTVEVGGEPALVLAEHADALARAEPSEAVRLLPGHDQWVMGPGTKDEHVVPPGLRQAVTRKADLVVVGGVVRGTWAVRGGSLVVTWGPDGGRAPEDALAEQVERLSGLLDRPLTLSVE
ncbi:DNA glycosylase AlkZ-like family protein [Phycicoccus flavus]|uniref:Winged helix DNA-binding domain-containing protein n=1 Tax=Phycicoccus flavus TaxID=2502783 RepID=A0A8T6R5E5_9MICO|nr:crosslink repair DNA glycosylase YcaQ family protein [Phycicoccus flavus]NHA68813.1 winged helix DNA-binding domain-containing protein [Phycicoccus flavus]